MSDELLRARIVRLEAELRVRTELHLFPPVPKEFCRGGGVRSAWASGYECAWRGKVPGRTPYEREHLRAAYETGYDAGAHAAETAIQEAL